jgi:ribosome biogenesis GTPase
VARAERGLCDVVTEAGALRAVIVSPTVAGDGPRPCTGDGGRGRRTTAWRELLALPHGGILLDTPGLRGVGLPAADEGLDQAFVEISALARDCRSADCAHTGGPGCAVLSAVEDGRLPRRRLESYHRLRRENAHAAARTDARLRAETKRQGRQGARLRRAIEQSPNFKA